MSARVDCEPPPRRTGIAQSTHSILVACVSAMVPAIGVLGLSKGSQLRLAIDAWVDIHWVFALLICSLALLRYQGVVRGRCAPTAADIDLLSRRLTRFTYLMLYLVIGARQLIILTGHGLPGTVVEPDPSAAGFDSRNDYHVLLASALCALAAIRVFMTQAAADRRRGPR